MSSIVGKKELISKANSRIFLTVAIASVVVSASLVASKILLDQRSFQSRVIDAKTEVNTQLEENIIASEDLIKSYEVFEKGDVGPEVVLDALPSKYDFAALSASVEKLVSETGIDMDSFSGEDESADAIDSLAEPAPEAIEFSLSVSGSYEKIQEFLSDLERSIRPIKINSMDISKGGDDAFSLSLSLTTYYQPSRNLEITKRSIQ